jgi:hypothetical protein
MSELSTDVANRTRAYEQLVDSVLLIMIRQVQPKYTTNVAYNCGISYKLVTPEELNADNKCIPCDRKDHLSRSIWAYINPRTMQPYDDDYWFR